MRRPFIAKEKFHASSQFVNAQVYPANGKQAIRSFKRWTRPRARLSVTQQTGIALALQFGETPAPPR
jgi:hypothetical protein